MLVFVLTVQSYANQGPSFPGPFDNNSNATKVEDSADPFSPRMQNFDPFEDEFSKPSSTFDFSFTKGMQFQNFSYFFLFYVPSFTFTTLFEQISVFNVFHLLILSNFN